MADCQFFGLNAGPMHLENVFLHCANSVLLLLLLNSATGAFWRSAVVAALFALHPLRVESVAWISERKDVLSGFFFMLTLWFYVLHEKKMVARAAGTLKRRDTSVFYKLSLAAFIPGLLCKSMLVTVPLILLLLDFWPLQRFKIATWRHLFFEKLPFFLSAIVIGIITLFSQRVGGGWVRSNQNIFVRLENVAVNYFGYIEKLLWPQNLSFLYLRSEKIPLAEFVLAAAVLLGISFIAFFHCRRRPYFLAGWLWFLIMLLPVCGFFELGRLSIADRYTYLPSIGFYLMLTWAVADLADKISSPRLRIFFTAGGAITILILCATLTRQQIPFWKNTQTLMERGLQIDPDNYVARQNLHIYLFEKQYPNVRNNHLPKINSSAK